MIFVLTSLPAKHNFKPLAHTQPETPDIIARSADTNDDKNKQRHSTFITAFITNSFVTAN